MSSRDTLTHSRSLRRPFETQAGDGGMEIGTDLEEAIGLLHRHSLGDLGMGGWEDTVDGRGCERGDGSAKAGTFSKV